MNHTTTNNVDNDGGTTKGHTSSSSSSSRPRRKGRKRPLADQRFSAYLTFGAATTVCIAIFLLCYTIFLVGLLPLLTHEALTTVIPAKRGEMLRPVVEKAVQKIKDVEEKVVHGEKALADNVANAIQKKIASFRKDEGVTDASLLQEAVSDMNKLRKRLRRPNHPHGSLKHQQLSKGKATSGRSGFVVLGMHRSGTSMLSGLMATGMGYKTGGPLIGSAFDNEKGFFELVPAVLQNDEFMRNQKIWWSAGVIDYDFQKALEDKKQKRISFQQGTKALAVLNSPDQIPFLQKDPRMCITLKTWLPLLNSEPAVLFTYRHPLEVAKSLQRRENGFTLEHGLRLWIVYNMRGVQNSADLCRVTTSNEAILANPLKEVTRVSKELTEQCHVPAPPDPLTQEDVEKFVDTSLQHTSAQKAAEKAKRKILETHSYQDGATPDCHVYEYDSEFSAEEQPNRFGRELDLYMKAMKIYCDFSSGDAYRPNYEWPKLE